MRRRITNSVKINSDAISAILAPIYSDLPKTTAAGQHNLTYGGIEWPALKTMLDYLEKHGTSISGGRFYDLGCGRGRAVLYMAMSGLFDYSVGIEVLPERVSLAKDALNKLRASIPIAGAKVKLFEASFLNPAFKVFSSDFVW
jgi:SAM-dependent methyltransferase